LGLAPSAHAWASPSPQPQQQQEDYNFLQEVFDAAIDHARPGLTGGDLYTFIVDKVKEKRPELEAHLTKVRLQQRNKRLTQRM
jgi:nucleosome binding factor SPN SPT16 subunit